MKMNSINITSNISPSLQQKLALKPGQIVKAQVVKTEGQQVLLQLGNHLLKARTKVLLNPGDRLQLLVESAPNRSIELKIVTDMMARNSEEAVLAKLGLNPREELYTVFCQMVKYNLPVSPAAVIELYNLIHGYKLDKELARLAIWLKTVGVKVESEQDFQALQALQKFLKGESTSDEDNLFFSFLNKNESTVYGGYNIFGWPVAGQHIFLLTPESRQERIQPENCSLLLQLNSQRFGELWFKMELAGNNLQAGLICSNDKCQTILTNETGGLCLALQAVGYQIDSIDVEISSTKLTILDFIPEQTPNLFNINYRV